MPTDQERQQEFFREQRRDWALARATREGARRGNYEQTGESIRRFNETTRNKALVLAVSKRLRRVYFWGSTFCLFVLSPLLFFAPRFLGNYFGPSVWWLVPMFLGAIVVPLCALRGYFIWVRSNWYRWIAPR